jgi:hypothetical protein
MIARRVASRNRDAFSAAFSRPRYSVQEAVGLGVAASGPLLEVSDDRPNPSLGDQGWQTPCVGCPMSTQSSGGPHSKVPSVQKLVQRP